MIVVNLYIKLTYTYSLMGNQKSYISIYIYIYIKSFYYENENVATC